jgi:hypothetical protein
MQKLQKDKMQFRQLPLPQSEQKMLNLMWMQIMR